MRRETPIECKLVVNTFKESNRISKSFWNRIYRTVHYRD